MSAIHYHDLDLLLEPSDTASSYTVRVVNSPAGQASSQFTLPFSDQEIENFLLRIGRPRRRDVRNTNSPEREKAREFGGRLFDALFQGNVAACLQRSQTKISQQSQQGLRLRLNLTHSPHLLDLPWEYLYDASQRRFFCHSTSTSLVRFLDLPQPGAPLPVQLPLNVLVMIANPHDHAPLDVEGEWRKVHEALSELEERGVISVTRLPRATLNELQRHLRRGQYHIFHFIGHGGFDSANQDGVLLLEDERGQGRAVSGDTLGTFLHDHPSLRLALLNACEGARSHRSDPFAGVAQHLLQQGIPAVIAMQFEISDGAAITLAQEFYSALADGYPVDAALAEGRKAIWGQGNDTEWGTPVLYQRAQDGHLFDIAQLQQVLRPAAAPLSAARPLPPITEPPKLSPSTQEAPPIATIQPAQPATVTAQPIFQPANAPTRPQGAWWGMASLLLAILLFVLQLLGVPERLRPMLWPASASATPTHETSKPATATPKVTATQTKPASSEPVATTALAVSAIITQEETITATPDQAATVAYQQQVIAEAVAATLTAIPAPATLPPTATPDLSATEQAQQEMINSAVDATLTASAPTTTNTPNQEATAAAFANLLQTAITATLTAIAPAPTAVPATATGTATPNQAATATRFAGEIATALAATGTAQPTATPVATPDHTATAIILEEMVITRVAATLTAMPTPTKLATPTPTKTATATPTPTLAPGDKKTLAPYGITFVYVPAGEFIMGSPEGVGDSDEHPQRRVTLDAYWIGQTEVTNAQYRYFIEAGGYEKQQYWSSDGWVWRTSNKITLPSYWTSPKWSGDNQPVVGVSWYEADAYSRWLAQASGCPIQLPTEAQWEKAARGPHGNLYPWGNDAPNKSLLNFAGSDIDKTTTVGSYPAGASYYGALDMAGNVWERVADWYAADYYKTAPARNPTGPASGNYHVIRGGSYTGDVAFVRGAVRNVNNDSRLVSVGFRLVCVASPGL